MLPKPAQKIKANSLAFETTPLIAEHGFREYDARWLFPEQINLMGLQAVGRGLGTMLKQAKKDNIVIGHDYRAYSQSVKFAVITGLMATGMRVHDIGLALSPMAYFAQHHLEQTLSEGVGVAMITASHNENGWTGIKMGMESPLTFGVEEMARLKQITMENTSEMQAGGSYHYDDEMRTHYIDSLSAHAKFTRPIKAVIACGNGTAGVFAPAILSALGVRVIPLHCDLDYNFPHHNPNPEDLKMLTALGDEVRKTNADIGFAFDGDGDRCGVVDAEGHEIFADKMGVLLARDFARQHKNAHFVADVKSTGIFATDPVLANAGASCEYWMTGHSHMKRRVHETNALAGFEKSGHFFFAPPLGSGYDDGIATAIAICDMLSHHESQSLAGLYAQLPPSFSSPTMSPFCDDHRKYEVVEQIAAQLETMQAHGKTLLNQKIIDIMRVNGVRIRIEDGSWGLVRASSNKPGLVVVTESPVSHAQMHAMFHALDDLLQAQGEIGNYDQTLDTINA